MNSKWSELHYKYRFIRNRLKTFNFSKNLETFDGYSLKI